ncbi:nucleotidyltransferase domain-containing protein [Kutzneria kofuensis]|uniref:nucleotidyltransferase domain-containing protein n=1 Tax=Kutzneria kofuensis TaxID=103725 RepID=UPI0031E9DA04
MGGSDVAAWYGPWGMVKPDDAAALCAGLDVPWWICGGWAIEAYAAVRREHRDIDLGVFRRDLPAVIEHFSARFHVWAFGDGP